MTGGTAFVAARSAIPVIVKTPRGAEPSVRSFVVDMVSVLQPETYERIKDGEARYSRAVGQWKRTVQGLRKNRSDALERWRASQSMNQFFKSIERDLGFIVTNRLDALARDLGLSRSAVGYLLRFSETFSELDVKRLGLTWSKFQEILDIKDLARRRECAELLFTGKIRFDAEIRAFKRRANAERLHS